MNIDPRLTQVVADQPYPLLFMTISGAHLYGFPSPDSDYDLRGVHILPAPEVVGLSEHHETLESHRQINGIELDYVTHDAKKFFLMLLKKNGYVMEQLFSPLVVTAMPEHAELKAIAVGCLTRHHSHHYFGFADRQWHLFEEEPVHRVKPLLYVYRILLTGVYLMQTGQVEANLLRLNEVFRLDYLPELIARKLAGPEQGYLDNADLAFHRKEYQRLRDELDAAHQASKLPDHPTTRDALNDLLIRLRLGKALVV